MNKWLHMQSNILILVGLLVAFFAHGMGLQVQASWLFVSLGAIVLLGVPHGSLDVLFALRAYELNSLKAWVVFLMAYLLVAMGIILLWLLLPVWFFIGFLIFSALHFSDDLNTPNHLLIKLSYGAAVICLPSIVHGEALVGLYAVFVDASVAQRIVTISQWLTYPILLLMGIGCLCCLSHHDLVAAYIGLCCLFLFNAQCPSFNKKPCVLWQVKCTSIYHGIGLAYPSGHHHGLRCLVFY
jgi:hypothetical protein